MASFNLVFHDMMLFVENGEYCDILIPEVKEHDFRFGDPKTDFPGPGVFPANLLPGDYALTGIEPRPDHDRFRNHADEYLVLKRSEVAPVKALRRIGIRAPMPDQIHFFREVVLPESTASVASTVLNGSPESLAVKPPADLHTVVVFHYLDVDTSKVKFGAPKQDPLAVGKANLCIYAQAGKDVICMGLTSSKHKTRVNDLVHQSSPAGGGRHPTFDLTKGRANDEPNPGLGLDPLHMLDLLQLMKKENDEGGCYGAAISEGD